LSAWIVPDDQDVLTFRAFIYRITLPDGRYYVGKKNVYRCSGGKIVAESNWRDYWSSSKEVKALATSVGYANCQREILQLVESTGKALCLNGNIEGKYQRKVVQGWSDDARCERYMRDTTKQRRAAGLIA
jgi:hypothetical protein